MSQSQRHDCPVQIKPVSGGKKQFTVTTPHGEIKRTTARDYQAIAYSIGAAGGVRGVSFASTLQGAYKVACSWISTQADNWKSSKVYYGLLLFDSQST